MPRRFRQIRSYTPRKYKNPFFNRRRRKVSYFSLKIKLLIILIIIFAAGVGWLLLFNNYFNIDNVIIEGSQNIEEYKLYDITQKQLSKKRFFFFDQFNLFMFSKRQAKNAILDQYFVDELKINKNIPRTIVISFQEKTPAAVWVEGETYYYIDQHLNVISKVDSLDINTAQFVILRNHSETKKIKVTGITKKIGVGEAYLIRSLTLAEQFKEIDQDINNIFIINETEATLTTNLAVGPEIYFNIESDLGKQFKNLSTLLQEKLTGEKLKQISYIDLRFGDKIYYK